MADLRHQGWPIGLTQLGRLQACSAPACVCPDGLLFIWIEGRSVSWELRTRTGKRLEGGAPTEPEALRFGAVTLHDEGLRRMRVVYGRPVEVPRA